MGSVVHSIFNLFYFCYCDPMFFFFLLDTWIADSSRPPSTVICILHAGSPASRNNRRESNQLGAEFLFYYAVWDHCVDCLIAPTASFSSFSSWWLDSILSPTQAAAGALLLFLFLRVGGNIIDVVIRPYYFLHGAPFFPPPHTEWTSLSVFFFFFPFSSLQILLQLQLQLGGMAFLIVFMYCRLQDDVRTREYCA